MGTDRQAFIEVTVTKEVSRGGQDIAHVTDKEFRSYWVGADLLVEAPTSCGTVEPSKELKKAQEEIEKLLVQVKDLDEHNQALEEANASLKAEVTFLKSERKEEPVTEDEEEVEEEDSDDKKDDSPAKSSEELKEKAVLKGDKKDKKKGNQ